MLLAHKKVNNGILSLQELHWLPVEQRIKFNNSVLVYILNGV